MEKLEEEAFIWPFDGNNFFIEDWLFLDPYSNPVSHYVLDYPATQCYIGIFESSSRPWRHSDGSSISKYFNHGFNEETWKDHCKEKLR
jgi:hypothetical protein